MRLLLCIVGLAAFPCFSPSEDYTIRTESHTGIVNGVLFAQQDSKVISFGNDGSIRLGDASADYEQEVIFSQQVDGSSGKIYCGDVSPDGEWLAFAGYDSGWGIRLLHIPTRKVLLSLGGHRSSITALAFSADGSQLVSGDFRGEIRVWKMNLEGVDLSSDRPTRVVNSIKIVGHESPIYGVKFSPEANYLVSACDSGVIKIWEQLGSLFIEFASLLEHRKGVRSLDYSPNGKLIASGGVDRKLLLWDATTGTLLNELSADMGNTVSSVKFSPESDRLFASSQGATVGQIAIFTVPTGEEILRFTEHDNLVTAVDWSSDGGKIVSAGGNEFPVLMWDSSSGEVIANSSGGGQSVGAVGFAKQGALRLGIGFSSTPVEEFLRWPALMTSFDFRTFSVEKIDQTKDAQMEFRQRILQDEKGIFKMSKRDDNRLSAGVWKLYFDPSMIGRITTYSYSADQRKAIVGGDFALLKEYFPTDQTLGRSPKRIFFKGHAARIRAVSPSPDGRYLASVADDQTTRLWNIETAELLLTIFLTKNGSWVAWN
ncbi:MAG: WD40 repeat domain-containing protein, partial [Verrucomicrobiales bacterium]|nr:WD40 repeat domain-containing protein [Verrucomicrobiales bacterium]